MECSVTKITVFGQEGNKVEKRVIEFVKFLDPNEGPVHPSSPSLFDNITLLGKDSNEKYDLIMAWNDKSSWRNIYIGHWNDGVIG